MEFSFVTVVLINISVLSICMITLWGLKKQVNRYKARSEQSEEYHNALQVKHNALQEAHNALQEQHNALLDEFRAFQSATDRQYSTLQQEHHTLKEENASLRTGFEVTTREQKALQTAHDHLSGRHGELVEKVMPVFEILAREKLIAINSRNQN